MLPNHSTTRALAVQVVLCGEGKNFCAGIDLGALSTLQQPQGSNACEGRAAYQLRDFILELQVRARLFFLLPLPLWQGCYAPSSSFIHDGPLYHSLRPSPAKVSFFPPPLSGQATASCIAFQYRPISPPYSCCCAGRYDCL